MSIFTLFDMKLKCTNTLLSYPVFFSRNKNEKSDDDTSHASAYQGKQASENNSPSNDNHTENNLVGKSDSENNGKEVKHPHAKKGYSNGSIAGPDTFLSANKGDRYGDLWIWSALYM